jgi:hypothetical protein
LILFWAGDQAGGIASLREIEKSEPQFLSPPRYLAALFFMQGDYANFLTESERTAALSKDPQEQAVARAARTGWSAGGGHRMLLEMQKAQQISFDNGHSSGFELAYTCLLLGQKASAIHFLQAAFSAHDARLFSIPRDRFQADLKGDRRFEQLKLQLQTFEH